jgi:hypothetical protein
MVRIAKPATRIFAVLFLLLALLTQLDNAYFGPSGAMLANGGLAIVYACFALILLLSSTGGETRAANGLFYVAGFCILLATLGYWQSDHRGKATLFDFILVNLASSILHGVLGIILFLAGKMNTASQQVIRE